MSRSYRQYARSLESADEAARQRGLRAQAARPSPESFTQFATELTRSHARELILSQPVQLFGAPPLSDPKHATDVAAEIFTEGRQHRKVPAPVNYHAEG